MKVPWTSVPWGGGVDRRARSVPEHEVCGIDSDVDAHIGTTHHVVDAAVAPSEVRRSTVRERKVRVLLGSRPPRGWQWRVGGRRWGRRGRFTASASGFTASASGFRL
eukprot:7378327-Prymnesium_polylepis.2